MIRQFKSGDEKAIAELERECFSSPWSEKAILESAAADTIFFVFLEDGEILGYAGLQVVSPEGFVTNIAVKETARGRGIGRALVDALLAFGKEQNLAFISLEVRESNLPAISLYTKCGFNDVGKRKNFYENPKEDAKILTKEF